MDNLVILSALRFCIICLQAGSSVSGSRYYHYRTQPTPCDDDGDCTTPGTICFTEYRGCRRGLCGCQFGTTPHGTCIVNPVKTNTRCSLSRTCPRGSVCQGDYCHWVGQYHDTPEDIAKFVGESCHPKKDKCVRKTDNGAGYTSHGTVCRKGTCACAKGRIQDRRSCRRVSMGERGCLSYTDCGGDSLCLGGRCRCPAGYHEVARGKCGRLHARNKLGEGEICDETRDKDAFCGPGLYCARCSAHNNHRCWKFSSDRPYSGTPPRSPQVGIVLLPLLAVLASHR